jgi:hypothetical protein
VLLSCAGLALAAGPVAKITQIEGGVEYSRDGENWRVVTRNKYLFPGYRVRTAADGSAKVLNQDSGVTHDLGASTTIAVADDDIEVIAGSNFSEPEDAGGSFWQALVNKFSTTQRYTTVRRSVKRDCESVRIGTARDITLSPQFDELVWTNVGPEYAYRLTIDDEVVEVQPSSTGEMIRYEVDGLSPGKHSYQVEVVLDGEVEYTPRRPSELVWLSEAEEAEVLAELDAIRNDPVRNDAFVIADYLESQNLLVGAMDVYRDFFAEYPEENDMRPFLIKSYHDLKLLELKEKEAITYNTVQMQEGML